MNFLLKIIYFAFGLIALLAFILALIGIFTTMPSEFSLVVVGSATLMVIGFLILSASFFSYGVGYLRSNIFSHAALFLTMFSLGSYFIETFSVFKNSPLSFFFLIYFFAAIVSSVISLIISLRQKFFQHSTDQLITDQSIENQNYQGNNSVRKFESWRIISLGQGLFFFFLAGFIIIKYWHLTDPLPVVFGIVYITVTFLPINKPIKFSLYFSGIYSVMYFFMQAMPIAGLVLIIPMYVCFLGTVFLLLFGLVTAITRRFFDKSNPIKYFGFNGLITILTMVILLIGVPHVASIVTGKITQRSYQMLKEQQVRAVQQGNVSECDVMKNSKTVGIGNQKDNCYLMVAAKIKDPSVCQKISEWQLGLIDSCIIGTLDYETFSKNEGYYRTYCATTKFYASQSKCKEFIK